MSFRLIPADFAYAASLVPPDFTVTLSEGKSYQCHLILAAACSKTIRAQLEVNPEAREITIDLPDPCDQFSLIVSLFKGEDIELSEENMFFLCAAATSLGISSLLNATRYQMRNENIVTIGFEESDKFNGIISFIRDIHKGEVEISASSCDSYGMVENLIASEHSSSLWESDDKPNQYFMIDFDPYRVEISSYVMTSADTYDDRHPQCWMVIGSENGEDWAILDQRDYDSSLNDKYVTAVYEINQEEMPLQYVRYVKVMMTEPNFKGDWVFRLSNVEFFGNVKEA